MTETLDLAMIRRATSNCKLVGSSDAPIEHHASIDSTMNRASALADSGAPEGALVVATVQEMGRGRRERDWVSPAGGLYLSLLLRPDEGMLRRLPVTLLGGLAVAEALEAVGDVQPELKWPNDVMLGGKKVAGILGELTKDARGHRLILGVGVNVAVSPADLPPDLSEIATTLLEHQAGPPSLEAFLASFLERFESHYLAVQRGGGATILPMAWARMPLFGKPIRVRMMDKTVTGIASGLNATGGLVLELEDGTRTVVVAGEVEVIEPK